MTSFSKNAIRSFFKAVAIPLVSLISPPTLADSNNIKIPQEFLLALDPTMITNAECLMMVEAAHNNTTPNNINIEPLNNDVSLAEAESSCALSAEPCGCYKKIQLMKLNQ